MKISCNFVAVYNTTDWPIWAINIGPKRMVVYGALALGRSANQPIPIRGRKKANWELLNLRHYWGLWARPTTPRRPVHGSVVEQFRS